MGAEQTPSESLRWKLTLGQKFLATPGTWTRDNIAHGSLVPLSSPALWNTTGSVCALKEHFQDFPLCIISIHSPSSTHLVPVDSKLAQPVKSVDVIAACLNQLLDDVTGVHLDGHQGHNLGTLDLGQVPSNGLGELVQHGHLLLLETLQWPLVPTLLGGGEGFGHVLCPLDLTGCDAHLEHKGHTGANVWETGHESCCCSCCWSLLYSTEHTPPSSRLSELACDSEWVTTF